MEATSNSSLTGRREDHHLRRFVAALGFAVTAMKESCRTLTSFADY
ncbi:hypothetical protein OHB01_18435 [Microbispora hainanensis]|uniref:Uncharacterized protein n=1 Tax=Microbispora hainanensis TaxID=568844 RepID=A0ABZ1SGX3_9ACTN|nr:MULTISPECIES: hypothetical protein [Microbispora]NJP26819.1 hypothetical protein [Microbispora sp. CL1-1]